MAGMADIPRMVRGPRETTQLDRLYLEWSQFTTARTRRELDLTEALRKAVLWADCIAMKIEGEMRSQINWRSLEEARRILSEEQDAAT